MFPIRIVFGSASASPGTPRATELRRAIRLARDAGYTVGRAVMLGTIRGRIIGYNIGRASPYPGRAFPLLVITELGIAKCRMSQTRLV